VACDCKNKDIKMYNDKNIMYENFYMNISKYNFYRDRTVYALSTIFGQSAISIIRISGINATKVLEKFSIPFCKSDCNRDIESNEMKMRKLKPRFAHFVQLKLDDKIIDNCILLYFPGPSSFTGEDIIELHLHGSKAVINYVLQALSEIDSFEMSEPGEFTRMAFLNGKLDLVQAEGLLAVIHAETQEQLIQANKQLSGENSRVFNGIRDNILQIFANCEAMLDFPEDDLEVDNVDGKNCAIKNNILNKLKEIDREINGYLDDNHIGEKIENGFKIAIVGDPNVGKSSLINYLAKKPIAIVSEIAGTTRDLVTVNLNIEGYQVQLIDTAGIRETDDVVESIGVELAKNVIKEADIILVLSTLDNIDSYKLYINEVNSKKHIFVLNKMDDTDNGVFEFNGTEYISISIENEKNLDILMNRIKQSLLGLFQTSSPVITSKRQRVVLKKLNSELCKVISSFYEYQYLDIMTEDIRNLANYISELTGDISTDDVLDELFLNFCIGK
jgi:tRNA modification GTPase